jgi:hypothetical protein
MRISTTADRDQRCKGPNRHRDERQRAVAAHQRDRRRADHDDHEPGRGQRRQAGANAEKPWKDQPDRPEHLARADEPQERARQRHLHLRLHRLDGHRELRATRK